MLITRGESFDNAAQSRKNTKNTFNVITFDETKSKKIKTSHSKSDDVLLQ